MHVIQTLHDDITAQKSKFRDIMSAAKRLRRESSMDEDPVITDKLSELKQNADSVAKLSADRLSILEEALPLASHFHDAHGDLVTWLDDIEAQVVEQQQALAIDADQIKDQQDVVKVRCSLIC